LVSVGKFRWFKISDFPNPESAAKKHGKRTSKSVPRNLSGHTTGVEVIDIKNIFACFLAGALWIQSYGSFRLLTFLIKQIAVFCTYLYHNLPIVVFLLLFKTDYGYFVTDKH
jgi:hypothetical protein